MNWKLVGCFFEAFDDAENENGRKDTTDNENSPQLPQVEFAPEITSDK